MNICKKVSWVLLVAILATMLNGLSMTVFASGEAFEVVTPIWSDDFSDGVIDSRIVLVGTSGTGTVVEENGKLALTRTDTTSGTNDGINYYFNDAHTGYDNQVVALEFTLDRSAVGQQVVMRVRNTNGGDSVALMWRDDGAITAYKGGTDTVARPAPETPETGPYKFKAFLAEISKWYNEGLIDPFISTTGAESIEINMLTGKSGATFGSAGGNMRKWLAASKEDFDLAVAPYPALNRGEKSAFGCMDWSYYPYVYMVFFLLCYNAAPNDAGGGDLLPIAGHCQ